MTNTHKKVLITGVGGYIGSSLAVYLCNKGYSVVGFGRAGDVFEKLCALGKENLLLIEGDITDPKMLDSAMRGVDAIVHAAAPAGTKACERNIRDAVRTIVRGSTMVAQCAKACGIERVVHISTQAVYSTYKEREMPLKEESELMPDEIYGALKAEAEYAMSQVGAIQLRLTNVYGRGAGFVLKTDVVGNYIRAAREGKDIIIFGDGSQSVDFVHIDDVSGVVERCIDTEPLEEHVYNVASGTLTSVKVLAETIAGIAGGSVNVRFQDAPPGKIWPTRILDNARVRSVCPWFPERTLEDGLEELLHKA